MDTRQLDAKYLYRPDASWDIDVERTEGSYVIAKDGKHYLDFMMGWCVGNVGWGNEHIRNTIRNYNGPDYVYPNLLYKPWAELAELLCSIAPGNMNACIRNTGGSESVDTALQIAMAYTGRKKFLSIENSYHGNTIGPLSVGASEHKDSIESLLPNCLKIDAPLDDKTLSKVETRLRKGDVAAFIMEPIICNTGVYIPSQDFMTGLRELCTANGTILIMDEVATGFGRTGKMFATEHFKIAPDVICLAKGITGGYAPMGATLTTEKIARRIKDKVNIYSTYGWHPLATDVALSNVQYILKNKISLFDHVSKCSQKFRTRLSQMQFKDGGELNIIGLALAVEVGKTSYATEVQKKCLEKGLLLTAQETRLTMFPSLKVEMDEIDKGLDILESCL